VAGILSSHALSAGLSHPSSLILQAFRENAIPPAAVDATMPRDICPTEGACNTACRSGFIGAEDTRKDPHRQGAGVCDLRAAATRQRRLLETCPAEFRLRSFGLMWRAAAISIRAYRLERPALPFTPGGAHPQRNKESMNIVGATCPACRYKNCRRSGVSDRTVALLLVGGCIVEVVLLVGAVSFLGTIHGRFVAAIGGAIAGWLLIHLQEDTQRCPSCGKVFGRHGR